MDEKTIIRNPSPEEVEKVNQTETTPGEVIVKPKKKIKSVDDSNTDYRCEMKEISVFEPKPELFILPTRNKIYNGPGITDDGGIYIRRFTTLEEDMVQTALARDNASNQNLSINSFLHLINDAINSCIKSKVSINELSMVDKIPLIVKLIEMSYGKMIKATLNCTECNTEYTDVDINLESIIINYIKDNALIPQEIELKKSFPFPVFITLTIPLIEHDDAFNGDTSNLLGQYEALIIDARGEKPDGQPITKADIPSIIENLHKEDKQTIKEFMESFGDIGTDLLTRPMKMCTNIKGKCSLADKKVSVNVPLKFILTPLVFNS